MPFREKYIFIDNFQKIQKKCNTEDIIIALFEYFRKLFMKIYVTLKGTTCRAVPLKETARRS